MVYNKLEQIVRHVDASQESVSLLKVCIFEVSFQSVT